MKIASSKLLRSSLRIKFLLLILLILGVIVFGVSLVLIGYQNNQLKRGISERSVAFAKLSARPIGSAYDIYFNSGFSKFQEILDTNLKLDQNITRVQIIDVNGFILFDSSKNISENTATTQTKVEDSLLSSVTSDKTAVQRGTDNNAIEIIEPYYDDFGARPFSVRYFVSYASLGQSLSELVPIVIGISFLIAIISGLFVIFTVNRTIISPIEKIVKGASEVSKGHLEFRINVGTGDELEILARAVNGMAAALQKNIEDLKQLDRLKDEFIIITSHNLRTPITILKGYTNQLLTAKKGSRDNQETYKAMTIAIANLEGMIEEFLSIVSLETEKNLAAKTPVDLVSLVKQSISYNNEKAQKKKITIEFTPGKLEDSIMGDVTKLKVAFNNLIENAIKFNKDQGAVLISIEEKTKDYVISIKDTGIGISEKESPLVFKKFHRATDILRYNYEGLGIGLYLSRVIIEAHQGKLWFESKSGFGSTFFVQLPKNDTEK